MMLPTAQTILATNEVINRVFGASQWYSDYRLGRKDLGITVYYKYKGRAARAEFFVPAYAATYEQIVPYAREAFEDTRNWIEKDSPGIV